MVVTNLTEEPTLDVEYQIVLASIGSFSICIKFYDWLRLFDRTSFYINLISMTIIEINYFLILYLASFFMFGFPLLMLNLYRTQDVNLFERNSYYQIISMVLHQYLLSLGHFVHENYQDHTHAFLVWILFIASTAFTQITMLNMLIAIMGNTFDHVTENEQVYTTGTKLQILGDYVSNFRGRETENYYLFTMSVV